ncbi:MAG: hypothetical protein ACM3PW_11950 [Chlamydiota bacterium]
MQCSPIRHLYRRGAAAVICALLSLATGGAAWAQYARRSQPSKGPRATALLQLQGKRARIIPIVILVNGQFYDASIYRADPVPMALDSGVVYEAERSGASVGLFTVGNALQVGNHWYGLGHWETDQQMEEAKKERAKEEAQAKAAQRASAQEEDSGPPVLRRPGEEKPPAPSPPPSTPPAQKPAQQTAKAAPPPPAPSSGPDEYDPNRPILRRGAPAAMSKEESSWPAEETPGGPAAAKPAGKSGLVVPKIEEMPAISDAAGPELRSYTFSLKPEERDADYKKMLAYAQEAVSKYERVRHTDLASAQVGEPDFHVFDVDLSNEPVFVLSAPATANFGAKRTRTAKTRTARRSAQLNEPVPGKQEQAYVTVVGKVDLYGEVKLIFSSVTDSTHLDEIPRLQLIDAVDVDGDRRAELLFKETTDSGTGYIIYRVYPDQLMQLFDSQGPED